MEQHMKPKNPLDKKKSSVAPIYKNTEKHSTEEITQETPPINGVESNASIPQTVQSPAIEKTESQAIAPVPQLPSQQTASALVVHPTQAYSTWQSPGQPATHDRRSRVPFDQRYRKENFMIDKRILPYVYHWIENNGMSKVDAINRAWLRILLADGYPVDPNLLNKPFRFEDVPK